MEIAVYPSLNPMEDLAVELTTTISEDDGAVTTELIPFQDSLAIDFAVDNELQEKVEVVSKIPEDRKKKYYNPIKFIKDKVKQKLKQNKNPLKKIKNKVKNTIR